MRYDTKTNTVGTCRLSVISEYQTATTVDHAIVSVGYCWVILDSDDTIGVFHLECIPDATKLSLDPTPRPWMLIAVSAVKAASPPGAKFFQNYGKITANTLFTASSAVRKCRNP